MKKIIFLTLGVVFLSSCDTLNNFFNDKEAEHEANAVTIEDRTGSASATNLTDSTSENVVVLDDSSFESQGFDEKTSGITISSSLSDSEKSAVIAMVQSGVDFILYFPYDDYTISDAATKQIIKHANFMRDNPGVKLRLEGHADERGTREYNLALGENRALSVKEVLGLYNLASRVTVISYGEERPILRTHDEEAWQKNRRVEFIYE